MKSNKKKNKELLLPTKLCSECGKAFPYSDLSGWTDIILERKPICEECFNKKKQT